MITDEPVRGAYAYLEHPGLLSLPGADQMRVFIRRAVRPPPIYHLTGLRPVEGGPGTATEAPATFDQAPAEDA